MKKIQVSYFKTVSVNKPKTINLFDWLDDTISPNNELEKKVKDYRKRQDKKLKLKIPCVTISASFSKIRNLDNIKTKNPLICLDIDKDSNPVADMSLVKKLFESHPSCLYCGYSISKKGVYAIIKISKKKPLIKYFNYFKKVLKNKGIAIDESCKDYTRLRFFSVDKEAHYNKKAVEFKIPKKPKKPKLKFKNNYSKTNLDKVENVVQLIEQHGIDITSNYADWVKIAGSLYAAFGEMGRPYFQRISKFHHDYNQKTTDRKFDNCRKMTKLTLSSFFYIADSYGIRY